MNLQELGYRIKKCRRVSKLTQEKLAEIIDVSPHYIYEIERGLKAMSIITLVKVALALNISIDYLIVGDNKINSEKNPFDSDRLFLLTQNLSQKKREHIADILEIMIPYLTD